MAENARKVHVSPGIYTSETEIQYAVKSLGITSLGLVGETVKGPAFQVMNVSDWREFKNNFGGTDPTKFADSQYPKYELPYIAKSYLTESNNLNVVRVLGLSGYNAGPAWLITASLNDSGKRAVAVLRSRGGYKDYEFNSNNTNCVCKANQYDVLKYYVGEKSATSISDCQKEGYNLDALKIKPFVSMSSSGDECVDYTMSGQSETFLVSQNNHGRFKICGITGAHTPSETSGFTSASTGYFEYSLSLNPYDKEYILNVLGTRADDGDAPIYVESLYDVALDQAIIDGSVDRIDSGLTAYQVYYTADYCHHEQVSSIMAIPHTSLTRRQVGLRVLADKNAVTNNIKCIGYNYGTNSPVSAEGAALTTITDADLELVKVGQIYTVKQFTNSNGKRGYYYTYYTASSVSAAFSGSDKADYATQYYGNLKGGGTSGSSADGATLVYNNADGLYYRMNADKDDVTYVAIDMNDYKSAYRYASTPWIVSNLKGDIERAEVNRLFRFHTITDGDNANNEIKVSIENIKPDDGTFDVVIRDINDVDGSIVALEKFTRCSMVPGDSNYIGYKIGTFDGTYEAKSKYVTVEINETTAAKMSVPCGFLGYPIPQYNGTPINGSAANVAFPTLKYNCYYDEDIKNRKQYFGLSSLIGVDVDTFTFKGSKTYIDDAVHITKGFHLDSRLDASNGGIGSVTVDGDEGYEFDCVSTNSRTSSLSNPPIIGTEEEMYGSIYENANLRKFTLYFYGGFDGWDVYRGSRTNSDDYSMTKYKGYVNTASGEGYAFNKIQDPSALGLDGQGITSDYYAYLSGIRQFANPEAVDINVFATPGIDYVNNLSLVEEAIEMIEEERADSLYVVTTPDKPKGASDYEDEMYTPEDAVLNLEDSSIDSNYTCTYYPWVKYLDTDNNQYINLPVTKDVVRNLAMTDNKSFAWYAPAGISRGNVDCVRAHFVTKVGDEDVLYEGRINPVKTFATDGVKIWGQKNLQVNESQLDRIAIRRLLLRLRKLIAISCIGLIFEPNDATTKKSFLSTVTPILDNMKSNRGISDYRIEVTDTAETRERRELPCKIYIKPIQALEWITIDFVVTPESVSFDDI